jgi:hypothetical protein
VRLPCNAFRASNSGIGTFKASDPYGVTAPRPLGRIPKRRCVFSIIVWIIIIVVVLALLGFFARGRR